MIYRPAASYLRDSAIGSWLKCSRGWQPIRIGVVYVADHETGDQEMLPEVMDEEQFVFPNPRPGMIARYSWDLPNPPSGVEDYWIVRKTPAGLWYILMYSQLQMPPTPMAVFAGNYNARATLSNSGGRPGLYSWGWKVKVWGACWGTLCQYEGKYWAATDETMDFGPEDIDLVNIAPASITRIRQGQGGSFTFRPQLRALPRIDGWVQGGPSIAMFWPGKNPEDFPWYLSSAAAGLSSGEGPKTTD